VIWGVDTDFRAGVEEGAAEETAPR
jgi:hypothetical protein